MPLMTDYKLEEVVWTEGSQHDECFVNGYWIKITWGKYKFYSEKMKSLDQALVLLEELKRTDGV
ncbi:hypothetical protein [Nitrosopumilus sp.]|uniref:hypothetical protein n=1 Tax=Nitrosopumilus sp. TaxID=2024843 RepID=UPI003D137BCA